MLSSVRFSLVLLVAASVAEAQQLPAIRPIGPVAAVSADSFGEAVFVRHLKSGVLVNDLRNRRLVMFDSMLATGKVIADSTPATANAYSARTAGLIPYRGDSTLFVDGQSLSMLVIDPLGNVGRVMSVPRGQDAMMLGSPMLGTPGFDGSGKLVYRAAPRLEMRMMGRPGGGAPQPPQMPDSAAVVRVDLASRAVDTLAFTKTMRPKVDVQRDSMGRPSITMTWNPLPTVDDWAVMSDGSVAVVRGRDYHIDWIRPDGTRESSPKIPFEWQRLTDEDKVAFIDSLKAARERMVAANQQAAPVTSTSTTVTGGPGGGEQRREMVMIGGGPAGGGAASPGGIPMGRGVNFVEPNELPDYKPPFFAGNTRADADGRLWIRTIPTKGITGGPVYDVINTKGELLDRVQLPANRVVVGFGADGVVYMLATEGAKRKLERARFK